jgi:prepilin-type N-terminal cleavage/methylation domain-containing protein
LSISTLSKKRFNLSKGFTLVELLVVIGIIGTLATLVLVQLGSTRAKGRDVKRIADINQLRSGLESYFDDNGRYPATTDLSSILVPSYLTTIPLDPLAPGCTTTAYTGTATGAVRCYKYGTEESATPTKYQISAELEIKNFSALNSDADFTVAQAVTGWTTRPGINGTVETCASGTVNDCIFDLGQK